METVLQLPDSSPPNTLEEVAAALEKQHLEPRIESKTWGDWIYLNNYRTVISIESMRGLSSSATIEHDEDENQDEPAKSILRAFASLGWVGIDEEGEFAL
ncbi:MAG: hypothetical protein AB8D78_04610 [Akkermansiaceae bacterium]